MIGILKRRAFFFNKNKPEETYESLPLAQDSENAREIVTATVSEFSNIPIEQVTNGTLVGKDRDVICRVLCVQFRRTIFADNNTTVGELIAQLEGE